MIRIALSTLLGERRWTQADLARATGCEALDCDIAEIIIREPNREIRVKSRRGEPIHKRKRR